MSLFTSLFLQCVGVIFLIVIVFQICGKLFLKDFQTDFPEDKEE
jgi:hypothetical protein